MKNHRIRFDNTAIAFASKSNHELRKMHLLFSTMKKPWMVRIGVVLTRFSIHFGLPIKGLIRNTIYEQFCGGESIEESRPTILRLGKNNIKTILDYSIEGESVEAGFDRTKEELIRICKAAKNESNIPFCVVKLSGIGSTEIMKKTQSGVELSEDEQLKFDSMRNRAYEISQVAKENELMFMIDAEETWIQNVIDEISLELMREFNKDYPHVFNTFQMYRHDMLIKLKDVIELAKAEGFHLGVKLVRGAYMEKERLTAHDKGKPSPIQPNKAATDSDFDAALSLLLENVSHIGLCAGTHNEKSCLLLTELMKKQNIDNDDRRFWFAQLLGMSDNISYNLAEYGYNVAKYVPYGPINKVMPYLFRRAKENTAIAGQSTRELDLVKTEIKRRK